jgi:HD-like signal output (HDOD) protein
MHQAALSKLFGRIGERSTLPALSSRLLAIATDDECMVDDLLVIVSSSPATEARMLRRLNASHVDLPQPISELPQAISALGICEVWNLAFTASLWPLFSAGDSQAKASGYNREELWHYSLAVAKAASLIASRCAALSPQLAYATGMLHHIGYFLLDQQLKHHHLRFLALAKHRAKKSLAVTELEETIFTFNHASLGGFASTKWKLPTAICHAIEFHHHTDRYEGEHTRMLAALVLAGKLCADQGWLPLGLPGAAPPLHRLFSELQLPANALEELPAQLAAGLK